MLNITFIDTDHLLIFCTPDFARNFFLFPSLSNTVTQNPHFRAIIDASLILSLRTVKYDSRANQRYSLFG